MPGSLDGLYRYIVWHDVEDWLARGWTFVCPVSVWAALMRAPG